MSKEEALEAYVHLEPNLDNKQNKNVFSVKVITTPEPFSGPATSNEDSELLSKTGIDSKYRFMGRYLIDDMPHQAFCPDPCDPSTASDKSLRPGALDSIHTRVSLSKAGGLQGFSVGDIIKVSCRPAFGTNGEYDLQNAEYVSTQEIFRAPSRDGKDIKCTSLPVVAEGKLSANFGALGSSVLGGTVGSVGGAGPMLTEAKDYTGMKNIIIDWYTAINAHASFNNTALITGPESPNVRAIAEAELNKWQFGKLKENKSEAAPYLRAYEQNQGLPTNYFPGKPWSAGYIVYVMKQSGTSFKSGASHYKYSRDLYKARMAGTTTGWSMFSVLERVKIGVGDVFVKPRGPKHYYSHGDVVYKIEDNVAYLTGGNVGNTAKIAAKIQLKEDGTIVSPGPYLVIDKFLG